MVSKMADFLALKFEFTESYGFIFAFLLILVFFLDLGLIMHKLL